MRPGVTTLPERLQEAGYYTVARMTGPLGTETGINRGFHDYQWRDHKQTIFSGFGEQFFNELKALYQSRQPWFVFLHIWVMHMPLPSRMKEGLIYRFPVGPLLWGIQRLDNSVLSYIRLLWHLCWRHVWGTQRLDNSVLANKLWPVLKTSGSLMYLYKRIAYERTLMALDRSFLGRLIQQINTENTVVAFLGDHGEFVDRRTDAIAANLKLYNRPCHGFHVYEYLTRVPFFLYGAGVSARKENNDVLSSQTDVVPTLLSLLGVDYSPAEFDGRDLLRSVYDEFLLQRPIFLEAVGGGNLDNNRYIRAVRNQDWKLVEAPWMHSFKEELYNIKQDPLERCNLRQERVDVAERLKQILTQHFSDDGDSLGAQYGDKVRMADEDLAAVEDRLRGLGYMD